MDLSCLLKIQSKGKDDLLSSSVCDTLYLPYRYVDWTADYLGNPLLGLGSKPTSQGVLSKCKIYNSTSNKCSGLIG